MPQRNRPWIVPLGQDTRWGADHTLNTGPQGANYNGFKEPHIVHSVEDGLHRVVGLRNGWHH
eukprot:7011884-Karenia_brevis.AAC.1